MSKRIPVIVWEQLDTAFGAPIWIDFIEEMFGAELKWSNGIPYRVFTQRIKEKK